MEYDTTFLTNADVRNIQKGGRKQIQITVACLRPHIRQKPSREDKRGQHRISMRLAALEVSPMSHWEVMRYPEVQGPEGRTGILDSSQMISENRRG